MSVAVAIHPSLLVAPKRRAKAEAFVVRPLRMPTYQPIDLGFSTADGERPEFHFVGRDIQFSFVDWQEKPVRFTASDVRAFSWLEELDVPSIRDDVTYEVLESDLIRKYCTWNVMRPADGYRHFKLCFNAAGVFDVLCKTITVV